MENFRLMDSLKELKETVKADLFRVAGSVDWLPFLRHAIFGESFRYIFWMRVCAFSSQSNLRRVLIYPVARVALRHFTYKFGISIPYQADIGPGFYIGHFGNVFVSDRAVIGRNCNLSQGVTIGKGNRGQGGGFPVLGDRVYVGPGAKIYGSVNIGDDAAIGANAVVTKDVPAMGVVGGVPARLISDKGSVGYINKVYSPSKDSLRSEK